MNEKELLALLAFIGSAFAAWVQVHAALVVSYLDKYWDKKATNQQLENQAVAIFRQHILGKLTPENFIRWAVRRTCRLRKGIQKAAK